MSRTACPPIPLAATVIALAAGPAVAAPSTAPDTAPVSAPPTEDVSPSPTASEVLLADGARLIVAAAAPLWPGERRSVYLAEARPDPRDGSLVEGWRYAGDGRVVWVGEGVVELALAYPLAGDAATSAILRAPLDAAPTAVWMPQAPPPVEVPAADGLTAPEVQSAEAPPRREGPRAFGRDRGGVALGDVHDAPFYGRGAALRVTGGYAGDGFDSGLGLGTASWRVRPARGPGLVEVGVEGLWGQRWLEGEGTESYGLEPAVAYRVWSRVDSPGVGLAVIGGLGAGVGAEGLGVSGLVGLRSGHPDATRVEVLYEARGGLGGRLSLDGRVAVRDALRVGARSRVGDLPRHDGAFRQLRADGAAVLAADLGSSLTLELAAGAGGYDLLWADAGFVADGALEVRW